MKSKRIISWLVLVGLLSALALTWFNRFAVYDWFRLRSYDPSPAVVQLAKETTMTDTARHLFYVNRPEIQNKTEFNSSCPNNGGEQTIVLGCYRSGETGIFLYSVKDPKLNGVVQVTAAHEDLHAAYERLSKADKAEVDKQLTDFYKNGLKDKRIKDVIALYKQTEPNDVVNEMHSVFGTEVRNLPRPLEQYYRRYFTNRSKIVGYAEAYQNTFNRQKSKAANLLSQIKANEQQLEKLRSQIDSSESSLNGQYQALIASRGSSSATAYNAKVDAYNAEVAAYKTLISTYNQLVSYHNQLVVDYQNVATETNQLFQKLNSRSATVSTQ